jgi:hypothetical protein
MFPRQQFNPNKLGLNSGNAGRSEETWSRLGSGLRLSSALLYPAARFTGRQPLQVMPEAFPLPVFGDRDVPRDPLHPTAGMAQSPIAAEPSPTLQELHCDHLGELFRIVVIASRPLPGGSADVWQDR